jgi:cytidylate kinase
MNPNQKFVITISREMGSGGRTVGRKLAQRLGVKYCDKALIEGLVKEFHLSVEEIEKLKGGKQTWLSEFFVRLSPKATAERPYRVGKDGAPEMITPDDVFEVETRLLKELAAQESCVIAGRSGFFVLKDIPNRIDIFLRAPMESRIRRVMRRQGLSEEEAVKAIKTVDAGRENFVRHYAGTSRYDARNYDLILNVGGMDEDAVVDLILQYIATF